MAFLQTLDVQCNQDRRAWHFHKHLTRNGAKHSATTPSLGFPKRQTSREIGELTSSKDRDTGSGGELGELLLPGKATRHKKRTHAWL